MKLFMRRTRGHRPEVFAISRGASLLAMLSLSVALGSVILLAGCGDDGGTQATDAQTTVSSAEQAGVETTTPSSAPATGATTTSTPPTASTQTSLLSSSERDLGNGRVRAGGFVKRAFESDGRRMIEIDYADFLTGDAAKAAAAAVGEEVNNDYFISNQNSKLRTFSVSASSFAIPQGGPEAPLMGSWEEFKAFVPERPFTYWWIEREGDDVVLVEGQWVP